MHKNEFEDKLLNKIERINEGLALGILKLLFTNRVKRAFKTIKKNDPELFSTLDSLEYHNQHVKDRIARYKKEIKTSDDPETVRHAKEMLDILRVKY